MSTRFDEVVAIMRRLRSEGGCPWDRKQTRESLQPYLIEEVYEVLETIDAQDDDKLKEELGDLLLQILFHAEIGRERKTFTIDDVLQALAEKLVRRHPHVFAQTPPSSPAITAAEVVHRWEEIKRQEKAERSTDTEAPSALDGVPKALPALLRAYQFQVRASRIGFDWPDTDAGYLEVVAKVLEELQEVQRARAECANDPGDRSLRRVEDEIGDLLFAVVNLARHLKLNPEEALRKTSNRFADRFARMETDAKTQGRRLSEMPAKEQDALWEQAKAAERKSTMA
jgi:tetrapyrrole methylase family protein/MazG family protein